MSTVRAKFKVEEIKRTMSSRSILEDGPVGQPKVWKSYSTELHTIILSPVYSDDPNSENRAFWDATPSGKIELSVVHEGVGKQFELGREYYVDFLPAAIAALT